MTDPHTSREAAWAEVDRKNAEATMKRDALKEQRRRLEWGVAGSLRDIQRFMQTQPVQVDNLITVLTLVRTMALELREVRAADKELDDDEF
jgi:hypothetical protein